jgi:hypothetical protein
LTGASSWSGTPPCTLVDSPVTTYVDALRASYTAPGSATTRRVTPAPAHDFTRECFVCVAPSSSSSTDAEPALHHRAMDAQRRALLTVQKCDQVHHKPMGDLVPFSPRRVLPRFVNPRIAKQTPKAIHLI